MTFNSSKNNVSLLKSIGKMISFKLYNKFIYFSASLDCFIKMKALFPVKILRRIFSFFCFKPIIRPYRVETRGFLRYNAAL